MKILVCDPSFYQINYEINPWMKVSSQADSGLAVLQWNELVSKLESLNVEVVRIPPATEYPDMVFTANAGFMAHRHVILSNFKYKERQGEKEHFKKWFLENSYKVVEMPQGIRFEGAGDCLVNDEKFVFMGHGFRSDLEAYCDNIWDAIFAADYKSIILRLFDPYFYHLDTCFCPLNKRQILIYPAAFDKHDITRLEKSFELLKVPEVDAKKFACNAVLVGDNIIIPKGCEETKEMLTKNNYIVHEIEVSEFIKAGGACKCLTMNITPY